MRRKAGLEVDVVAVVVLKVGRTRDIADPECFKTLRCCGEAAMGDGLDDRRSKAGFGLHSGVN